jgi:hypothetical protein
MNPIAARAPLVSLLMRSYLPMWYWVHACGCHLTYGTRLAARYRDESA